MVTRAELLEQLSALLGVQVLDVHRSPARAGTHGVPRNHPSFRPREAGEWYVSVVLPTVQGMRRSSFPLGSNSGVRSPRKLNRFALRLGRPPDAPALSAEGGHRVLKLLYAINETETEETQCPPT